MAKLLVAAPRDLAMQANPMVAVPPYYLNLDSPMLQVVEGPDSARPNHQLAVVQDSACPTRRVVEELGCPNLRLVAVGPGPAPSRELVVEEPDLARPIPVFAVEPGSVLPNRLVARDFEQPRNWVVGLVVPRGLLQA